MTYQSDSCWIGCHLVRKSLWLVRTCGRIKKKICQWTAICDQLNQNKEHTILPTLRSSGLSCNRKDYWHVRCDRELQLYQKHNVFLELLICCGHVLTYLFIIYSRRWKTKDIVSLASFFENKKKETKRNILRIPVSCFVEWI